MRHVKEAILDAIEADTAFATLTGATADDPRLYWYYNGDALVDQSHPAYVTYALTAGPQQATAVRQPSFTFVIWAKDTDVTEGVRDRLVALFEHIGLNMGGKTLFGTLINEADQFQQQPQFAGRNMVFQFGYLGLR